MSDCADFYVTLKTSPSLVAAASGEVSPMDDEDGVYEICAEGVRDFALAIGDFEVAKKDIQVGGRDVAIKYFYSQDEASDATLSRAANAVEMFSQAFGDYPYPAFSLVQADIDGGGGMEYGAFATVSPSERENYLDAVAHEVAHQWWYGAVGSDQINSAWLDEGLSEFCTYYLDFLAGDRKKYGDAIKDISRSYSAFAQDLRPAGFSEKMERPLSSFLTTGEYVAVVYKQGALLFDMIRGLVGDKKFVAAMRVYFEDNKFGFADKNSLISAFKTQGYDISPILAARL